MKKLHFQTAFRLAVVILALLSFANNSNGQAWLPTALNEYQTPSNLSNTYRLNRTSIGQALPLSGAILPVQNDFKLRVFGGAFAQVQRGTYGNFTTNDQWAGLAQNPTLAGIYGLGMHRTDRYAFYNLDSITRVAPTKDLIIGLGSTGTNYDPNQRILMKGFFGPLVNNSRVLLSANLARGSVGINDENPLSTFFVNATGATGSTNFSSFRSMFIINRGTPTNIPLSTFSAMGQEGNSVLNLPVHGFRTQAGDSNATVPLIAANFSVNTSNQLAAGRQEAEIQWQDLNFLGAVGCSNYTGGAQDLLSFYFRNGVNTSNTRRRVMTMLGGAHVGINIPAGNPVTAAGVNPFVAGNMFNVIRLHVRSGSVLANGYYASSDSVNKTNVKDIPNAMKLLDGVRPRSYDFNIRPDVISPVDPCDVKVVSQYGFIAQEIARSEVGMAVAKMDDGSFAVEYNQFIPILVQAMKEVNRTVTTQATTISDMAKVIDEQKVQMASMTEWAKVVSEKLGIPAPAFTAPVTAASGRSAGANAALPQPQAEFAGTKLLQNYPNPTNGYTEIFYEFNDAGNAAINVTDLQGRVRKTFNNVPKGMNKVVINRGDLEAGSYIYSIVVNGRVAASKQLVIVR
jgi:Secretion system C-terminal sorting domain/Chaperone of endosialidase